MSGTSLTISSNVILLDFVLLILILSGLVFVMSNDNSTYQHWMLLTDIHMHQDGADEILIHTTDIIRIGELLDIDNDHALRIHNKLIIEALGDDDSYNQILTYTLFNSKSIFDGDYLSEFELFKFPETETPKPFGLTNSDIIGSESKKGVVVHIEKNADESESYFVTLLLDGNGNRQSDKYITTYISTSRISIIDLLSLMRDQIRINMYYNSYDRRLHVINSRSSSVYSLIGYDIISKRGTKL